MTDNYLPVRRALLSVSDKTGITQFAAGLRSLGIELISTGGTAALLTGSGIEVTEISDYTGFPEMMGGRLKTLHPKIHGGILGRRGVDDAVMQEHGIAPIDLVVVNLYPFAATVADPNCPFEKAVENIDIGGPTMVRAAAKNHADVAVVVRSTDYGRILEELRGHGCSLSAQTRFALAVAAFEHTAAYDGAIANYLSQRQAKTRASADNPQPMPDFMSLNLTLESPMRYGENPHQQAAFYIPAAARQGLAAARQIQGKALSYNNIADSDAAVACVSGLDGCGCVIVKHANPCGAALGQTPEEAYLRAFATDPESAFGGIIAFNRPLNAAAVKCILDRQFCEVIIAPAIDESAAAEARRKPGVRLLELADLKAAQGYELRCVSGGVLVQQRDTQSVDRAALRTVSRRKPDDAELEELLFAWHVCKYTKSNAIVYTKDRQTLGIGCGQTSRVFSARTAALRAEDAHLDLTGAALASDAFFPFRDGVDAAARAGIRCIIQPGGSVRDPEVIAAADEHDIAMVFTGIRHFRH